MVETTRGGGRAHPICQVHGILCPGCHKEGTAQREAIEESGEKRRKNISQRRSRSTIRRRPSHAVTEKGVTSTVCVYFGRTQREAKRDSSPMSFHY